MAAEPTKSLEEELHAKEEKKEEEEEESSEEESSGEEESDEEEDEEEESDANDDSFHSPAGEEGRSPSRELTPVFPVVVPGGKIAEATVPISPKTGPTEKDVALQRISQTSLDEVDLSDETAPAPASIRSRSSTSSTSNTIQKPQPPLPPRGSSKGAISPPPPVPEKEKPMPPPPPPPPPPPAAAAPRKGPFSWLSRSSTSSVPQATSPTSSAQSAVTSLFSGRRNTTSSAATLPVLTPVIINNNGLPTLNTPLTPSFLFKPAGADLIQQRFELTKDNHSHADAAIQEDASKGADSLRASFRQIREASSPAVERGVGIEEALKEAEAKEVKEATPLRTPADEEEIDWDFWSTVVEDYYSVASKSSQLLTQHIQAGIPATIRGTVWQAIAQSKNESLETIYKDFNALAPNFMTAIPMHRPVSNILGNEPVAPVECRTISQLEKEIKKDLGQRTTFANYKGFRQEGLMGLMKAYAVYDPEVGYVQGMAFLGAPLLLNMTEEEAFCLLTELMSTYSLRDMFTSGMKGLHLRLYQYDRLLEDLCPALSVHLSRRKADSKLYATQWFLTLFAYKFPLQLVLRVYDLIISEGVEGAVLKFGIALMRKNEAALRNIHSLEELLPFLREKLFDAYIDTTPSPTSIMEAGFFGNGGDREVYRANDLVKDACDINITPEMLHQYTVEWVEMDKRETEELIEKETLRSQNVKLTAKVKQLNFELQELTQEHVLVATDLVHKKMENTQLVDENEGLKIEVDELKSMVEKQPREVEAQLKDEMDRIMKRNLEVHNENQSLEDQMREMEMELVGTKMNLAEINEAHELLKTRWNDLRKALGD